MKSNEIFALLLLGVVIVISFVLFYIGYTYKTALYVCQNEESPYCFTFTCPVKTETCGLYAYRCLGDGKVRCDNKPLINQDIKVGDNICN
jgi:hypothetical protein